MAPHSRRRDDANGIDTRRDDANGIDTRRDITKTSIKKLETQDHKNISYVYPMNEMPVASAVSN